MYDDAEKMKIDQPKIPQELSQANFQDIYYEEDPHLNNCQVTNSTFDNEDMGRVELSKTVIRNSSFQNTKFRNIDLTDVIFENCDFSNGDLSEGNIHRAVFKGCKLMGVNFSESRFGDVLFEECVLNLSAFGYANLKKSNFIIRI